MAGSRYAALSREDAELDMQEGNLNYERKSDVAAWAEGVHSGRGKKSN